MKPKHLYLALTAIFGLLTMHFLSIKPTASHTILAGVNLLLTIGFMVMFTVKANIKK